MSKRLKTVHDSSETLTKLASLVHVSKLIGLLQVVEFQSYWIQICEFSKAKSRKDSCGFCFKVSSLASQSNTLETPTTFPHNPPAFSPAAILLQAWPSTLSSQQLQIGASTSGDFEGLEGPFEGLMDYSSNTSNSSAGNLPSSTTIATVVTNSGSTTLVTNPPLNTLSSQSSFNQYQ